jgi:hypothetical protein
MSSTICWERSGSAWRDFATGLPGGWAELVSKNVPPGLELPIELLDDERSWQGDHDPYLAMLAHASREQEQPLPPLERAPPVEGLPDGDVYLAQLTRARRRDSDCDPDSL